MVKKAILTGIVLLLNLLFFVSINAAELPLDYKYKNTKALVKLVRDAADLIKSKGEEAFPEF